MIISLEIAIAFHMTGAELPMVAKDTSELLARMSVPAALLGAVLFATMPMVSINPILSQQVGLEKVAAVGLLAATVTMAMTIPAWLAWAG